MALHLIVIPLHSMATSEPCLSKNLSFSPSSPVSQHLKTTWSHLSDPLWRRPCYRGLCPHRI